MQNLPPAACLVSMPDAEETMRKCETEKEKEDEEEECNVPVAYHSERRVEKASVGLRGKVWLLRDGVLVGFLYINRR